jgi:hypothetical protein
MWFIIRKNPSKNQLLSKFNCEMQTSQLRVRDIIKFGRVNFKITEIKSDRIDKEFTGTCHSTNLSSMLFKKQTKGRVQPSKKHNDDTIYLNTQANNKEG